MTDKKTAEKIKKHKLYDELTGLNTKDQSAFLVQEYLNYSSLAIPYALAVIDVKDFKQVNKTFGHLFGDSVLIQVADIIVENIGKNDIAGRIGGDEFIVFLKNESERTVINICNKLRRAIKNIYIGAGCKLDVYMGVVCSNDLSISYDNLLMTADTALNKLVNQQKAGVLIADNISEKEDEMKFSPIYKEAIKRTIDTGERRISELILDLFEQAKDIDKAMNAVLALVGKKKSLARISIYAKNGKKMSLTHFWTKRGVDGEQWKNPSFITEYLTRYNKKNELDDISKVYDINSMNLKKYMPEIVDEFEKSVTGNMICCNIIEMGKIAGVICFTLPENKRLDDKEYKSFRSIARLISAYTVKGKALEIV